MGDKNLSQSESEVVATSAATVDRESSIIAIVAIITTAVVLLGCIFSCAIIAYAFLNNAPW